MPDIEALQADVQFWTAEIVQGADVVATMGCGDARTSPGPGR